MVATPQAQQIRWPFLFCYDHGTTKKKRTRTFSDKQTHAKHALYNTITA